MPTMSPSTADVTGQSHAERRALAWIVGVGVLVVVFRVVLFFLSPPRGSLPPLISIWDGAGNTLGYAAAILALDALLVLLSRRPRFAWPARVLLHGLFVLMVICGLIATSVWLTIGDGRGAFENLAGGLQLGIAFGLMSAVQWISLQAAVERIRAGSHGQDP